MKGVFLTVPVEHSCQRLNDLNDLNVVEKKNSATKYLRVCHEYISGRKTWCETLIFD